MYGVQIHLRRRNAVGSVTLLLASVIGIALIFFRDRILPDKFSSDSDQIQLIAMGELSSDDDSSFAFTSSLYSILGVADSPIIAGLLGIMLPTTLLFFVIYHYREIDLGLTGTVSLFAFPILTAIFLGTYSKDAFVSVIVLLILGLKSGWKSDLLIALAMLFYGIYVRPYWVLIAAAYLGFKILTKRNRRISIYIFCVGIVIVALSLFIYIYIGAAPDTFRSQVNVDRLGASDATTTIEPFITITQPYGGIANNILTALALTIPWPLASLGLYHKILFIAISAMWITFFVSLKKWININRFSRNKSHIETRSIAVILTFLAVQALFEPDYGSALRHLSPLFPLILVIFISCKRNTKSHFENGSDLKI
ncbi:hypothetical protein [Arthrobacter sp. H35-D1]|uniref:hypothetical protein n=1 Tax=Arthrobacter sp. H35-D1 TaxID=3046202 RepID=UPI0024BA949D|nr:hypothetical protein [Arthrobacter sp. H35-D1]